MTKTKEELIIENAKLKNDISELRTDFYNCKDRIKRLEGDLEEKSQLLEYANNQIHFLAGILYKEGVSIHKIGLRLDVVVEDNEEDD